MIGHMRIVTASGQARCPLQADMHLTARAGALRALAHSVEACHATLLMATIIPCCFWSFKVATGPRNRSLIHCDSTHRAVWPVPPQALLQFPVGADDYAGVAVWVQEEVLSPAYDMGYLTGQTHNDQHFVLREGELSSPGSWAQQR
jgi:hypothetical protein